MYGHFLINHRAFERGLSYIDRALALDPLQAEHHVGRGFGFLGQGRVEDAVAAYRRAGELDPANAGIAGTLLLRSSTSPVSPATSCCASTSGGRRSIGRSP